MSNKTGKIIGGLVFVPFVLIALGVAYCEINKAYWDHKVKELCEKDGGVSVFEKVEISRKDHPNLINDQGVLIIKTKDNANSEDPYYILYKDNIVLNKENPYVWRSEYAIVRKSDGKELGVQTMYSRRGGDIPTGISHESHFSCNKIKDSNSNLTKAIFTIRN